MSQQKLKQISLYEQHMQILYDNFGYIMHSVENLISKLNPLKIQKKLYSYYDNFGNADDKGIPQIKNEILSQLDFFVSAYQAFTLLHKNEKFLWPSNIEEVRNDLKLWKNYVPDEYKRFIIAVEELMATKKYTKFNDEQEISDNDPSVKKKTPEMWMSIGMKVVDDIDTKLKRFEETNKKAEFKRGETKKVDKKYIQARKKFLVDTLLKQALDNGELYLQDTKSTFNQQNFLTAINNFKYSYEIFLFDSGDYQIPNEYCRKIIYLCDKAKPILNNIDFDNSFNQLYNILFSYA
jgi:hypothetical protein